MTFQTQLALALVLVLFLAVPILSKSLDVTLDSLPMRFAAVLLILASLAYDKYVAIAAFLLVAALYIQRHHDSVQSILGPEIGPETYKFEMPSKMSDAPDKLEQGGSTDVEFDSMEFMPKSDDQTNEFAPVGSIDEKRALQTEPLGARAQSLFPDDQASADFLQHSSRDAAFAN